MEGDKSKAKIITFSQDEDTSHQHDGEKGIFEQDINVSFFLL